MSQRQKEKVFVLVRVLWIRFRCCTFWLNDNDAMLILSFWNSKVVFFVPKVSLAVGKGDVHCSINNRSLFFHSFLGLHPFGWQFDAKINTRFRVEGPKNKCPRRRSNKVLVVHSYCKGRELRT